MQIPEPWFLKLSNLWCQESLILKLVHLNLMVGHMVRDKTLSQILLFFFFWPVVHKDVAKLCDTCATYQMSTPIK